MEAQALRRRYGRAQSDKAVGRLTFEYTGETVLDADAAQVVRAVGEGATDARAVAKALLVVPTGKNVIWAGNAFIESLPTVRKYLAGLERAGLLASDVNVRWDRASSQHFASGAVAVSMRRKVRHFMVKR